MADGTIRYTKDQLASLYDNKDWEALWKIITPMVKHAVRKCMQEGLDPQYVREDLMQEANLAAWECLPQWNAFEGTLTTWIYQKIRGAVLNANQRETTGMVGGRESGVTMVSMHGEVPDDDYTHNDEQGIGSGIEATLAYEDPPEGLGDPADELYLLDIPPEDRDMVRRLAGIGVPRETQAEYAAAEGIHRDTVTRRLRELKKLFCKKA